MHLLDRLDIYLFHRTRFKKWRGRNAKALGWSGEEAQHKRFKVIAEAISFDDQHVLDLGCGFGDLLDYFHGQCTLGSYTGIDQHRAFVAAANQKFSNDGHNERIPCRFILGDFSKMELKHYDIVVASGALNYRSRDEDYLSKTIKKMYAAADKALIFNLLNADAFPVQPLLVSYNKHAIYRYCKMLCSDVLLIDDYAAEDFTIVMMKSASSPCRRQ